MDRIFFALAFIVPFIITGCSDNLEEPSLSYEDHIIAGLEPKGSELQKINFTRINSLAKLGVGFDDTYPVDLDGDGIDDLILVRDEVSDSISNITLEVYVIPQEGVEIVVHENNPEWVEPLDLLHRIDENQLWASGERLTIFNSYRTDDGFIDEGLWEDQGNKSIGVKIRKDGANLYGWVWINIANKGWGNASWILEYASTIGYQE